MNFNEFVTLLCLIKAAEEENFEEGEDQHSGGDEKEVCEEKNPLSYVNRKMHIDSSVLSAEQLAHFRAMFDLAGRCPIFSPYFFLILCTF